MGGVEKAPLCSSLQLCHSLLCPFMSCFAHHFGGRAHPNLDIRRVLCKNIISLPLADLILSKNQEVGGGGGGGWKWPSGPLS